MADSIVSRIGQSLQAGDVRALFPSIWSTEVLAKLYPMLVTEGKFRQFNLVNAKSHKFPVTGIAHGSYHTPGVEILGNKISHAEVELTVDDMFIADSFVARIDELMNHYDARSVYTTEQARVLRDQKDANILRTAILASRAAGRIPGETPGGAIIRDATYKTSAAALEAGLFGAATELEEKGVSLEGVYAYMKPLQHSLIVQGKGAAMNKDFNGEGSYARGVINIVGGVQLQKTTNLPTQDLSSDLAITAAGFTPANIKAAYRGDFSSTACVIAGADAVGTVQLADLDVEVTPMPWKKGTLIVASYILGSGILRPEYAVELSTDITP